MKDIRDMSMDEFKYFLNSFDTVITDCDGVLWINEVPIEGALSALKMLGFLGKKVIFASNNNTRSIKDYLEKFRTIGYEAKPDQVMLPAQAITTYLKQIGFKGKAFVVGTTVFIDVLKDAGIDVIAGPNYIPENLDAIHKALKIDPDVKAVIFDFDINLNWVKMIQAGTFLQRDDVLFFTGPRDKKVPISGNRYLIGPGTYTEILINHTGRQPLDFAKPSEMLKNSLFTRYGVTNPERFIFVGDCLATDIKFAELCGFKKFFVGSGVDHIGLINKECEVTPDYYLPHLGMLQPLLQRFVDTEAKGTIYSKF